MNKLILGVEIGGTKQQISIGTPQGEILHVQKGWVDPAVGGVGIRAWFEEHIPPVIAAANEKYGFVAAIGCGFGGPIDTNAGRVLKSVQIEGWQDFPIRKWFEESFKIPAFIANDANAATWGEYCLGFGRGSRHFFYTNLGSGVGGGFVFDGKLYDGQGYGAGEFGHSYVPDWTAPMPGAAEKVENLCSGWAIEARLKQPGYVPESSVLYRSSVEGLDQLTTRDLAAAAGEGDAFALQEIDRIAQTLGVGLANVLCLTSVERIAIGGGVSKMGELLIGPVRTYTRKHEFINSRDRYEIQACELGESIVLVGATLIAAEVFEIT